MINPNGSNNSFHLPDEVQRKPPLTDIQGMIFYMQEGQTITIKQFKLHKQNVLLLLLLYDPLTNHLAKEKKNLNSHQFQS